MATYLYRSRRFSDSEPVSGKSAPTFSARAVSGEQAPTVSGESAPTFLAGGAASCAAVLHGAAADELSLGVSIAARSKPECDVGRTCSNGSNMA